MNLLLQNTLMGAQDHHPVSELFPRLIPSLICCFRSSLRKTAPAMRTGCQEAKRRVSGVLGELLSRNTCGGQSSGGRGVLPCRSGYPEQPRANHYHLDAPSMFTAAPGLNGFHMAPRHLRRNLYKAPNTQRYTFIKLMQCAHTRARTDTHTILLRLTQGTKDNCEMINVQYKKQNFYG